MFLRQVHYDGGVGVHLFLSFGWMGGEGAAPSCHKLLRIPRCPMDDAAYASLLRCCRIGKAPWDGKRVHAHIIRAGFDRHRFLSNLLVQMYGKCGSPKDARLVFDRMPHRNVFSWNIMIQAYAENGLVGDARYVFDKMPQRNLVSWNAMIAAFSQNGYGEDALELFRQMQLAGVEPDKITFVSSLDACAGLGALAEGKKSHADVVDCGFECDVVVGTALVNMYGKCGRLDDARSVFDKMPRHDVVSWTAMIAAYAQNGHGKGALELFQQMQLKGVEPNKITFISVLDACASLASLTEGKGSHAIIINNGFEFDVIVGTALVNMYGKCGNLDDAKSMFDKMPQRNVVSWNAMIAAYSQNGYGKQSLELFQRLQQNGLDPNDITFISILDACAGVAALEEGKEIHASIIDSGFEFHVVVGTALVNMYGKCGRLGDAISVFDKMPRHDAVSWNVLIAAYSQNGYGNEALKVFEEMKLKGVAPDKTTLMVILDGCTDVAGLTEGGSSHAAIARSGFEMDVVMGNALLTKYGRCGSLDDARGIFDKMPQHNLLSWNAMIVAYSQHGHGKEAVELFQQMQTKDLEPSKITFISVLDACADLAALAKGKEIHTSIIESEFESDVVVGTALVNMYGKCGSLNDARSVFDKMPQHDVVSWTAMISAYAHNGHGKDALKLFKQMQHNGVEPNKVTFIGVFDACAGMSALTEGMASHAAITNSGFESDIVVATALVSMYGKCGSLEDARSVFDKMPQRNVVSWNAMITAYSQNGNHKVALELFKQMQLKGVEENKVTLLGILDACANLAALSEGKESHARIIDTGFEMDVVVGNALINMYGKCGHLDDARVVFHKILEQNVVSWTTMIASYSQNGHGKESLKLFQQMLLKGVEPNEITFIGVLSGCSHAGLLDDGWYCFTSIDKVFAMKPVEEHFVCMIDLLGRAGQLDIAEDLVKKIPFAPCAAAWMSLLGACRIHGDVERGAYAADCVFELDGQNAAPFLVLSNIYAAAGMWDDATKVRRSMKDKGVKKQPGHSRIEVKNRVYEFVVGDTFHPQKEEIYAELQRLSRQMEEAGYMPDTKAVLRDEKEANKEHILCYHSEKLAIAFGLISTLPGAPLHITKSLRVCSDCHAATEFISKIVKRKIIVRDANRFHHFEHGVCSCGGYW